MAAIVTPVNGLMKRLIVAAIEEVAAIAGNTRSTRRSSTPMFEEEVRVIGGAPITTIGDVAAIPSMPITLPKNRTIEATSPEVACTAAGTINRDLLREAEIPEVVVMLAVICRTRPNVIITADVALIGDPGIKAMGLMRAGDMLTAEVAAIDETVNCLLRTTAATVPEVAVIDGAIGLTLTTEPVILDVELIVAAIALVAPAVPFL